jgi:hypothetical protein
MDALATEVERDWPVGPLVQGSQTLDLQALDGAELSVSNPQTLARLPAEIQSLARVTPALLRAYLRRLIADGFLPATAGCVVVTEAV